VLPAEVRRRPRRSSLPQKFGLPRRFVFTVEVRRWPRRLACASCGGCYRPPRRPKVQLVAELRLAEEIRVRRGGSARRGGCCRRTRRSSSSRRFVLLRRLLSTTARVRLVAELQLAEEVRVRRGSPARPGGCCRRPRRSSLTQRFLSADV